MGGAAMMMRLVRRDSDVEDAEWDAFVRRDPNGTFQHTSAYVRYRIAATPGAIDRSMVARDADSGDVIGVAPLVQEGASLLDRGEPGAWPLIPYSDALFTVVRRDHEAWGVSRFGFRSKPGRLERIWVWNQEWRTVMVSLQRLESELWANVRGSYHAIINKLRRDKHFEIRSATPGEVANECRALHAAAAGRETRPIESWRCQGEWVESGAAHAYLARRDGVPVGFTFVTTFLSDAYYFSGASIEPNVQHALQWHVIGDLRQRGFDRYEVGWVDRAGDDAKARGVEMFKRGWGGELVPIRAWGGEL